MDITDEKDIEKEEAELRTWRGHLRFVFRYAFSDVISMANASAKSILTALCSVTMLYGWLLLNAGELFGLHIVIASFIILMAGLRFLHRKKERMKG